MLFPQIELLRRIGHFSLKPLIELLFPVEVYLHAVELADKSVRVALPEQAKRVAFSCLKIDAHAQRSVVDPLSILSRALVL